jgi:hypothetical protein
MSEHFKQLFRSVHLSRRYRRTERTINNWKRNGILPKPDVTINGIDHWYPETIEANERERFKPSGEAAGSAGAKSRTGIEPRAGVEA